MPSQIIELTSVSSAWCNQTVTLYNRRHCVHNWAHYIAGSIRTHNKMAQLLSIFAAVLYSFSAYRQFRGMQNGKTSQRKLVLATGSIAILMHWVGWFLPMLQEQGINLSFFNGGSLISLVVAVIILVSALKKPVENLFIGLFPMAALIIALDLIFPAHSSGIHVWEKGLVVHVLLSILAYSLLTIAAFQAMVLIAQDHQLKHKHMTGMVRVLPPLQTMDKLLFEMVWAGFILLSLAIASGFIFLDDLFAQSLVHKTVLTILGWAIYAGLLFGRFQFGWRGPVASKWTLSGLVFLALAYFGSKLVIEFILKR